MRYVYNILLILMVCVEYLTYYYVLGGQRINIRLTTTRSILMVCGIIASILSVVSDSQLLISVIAVFFVFTLTLIIYDLSIKKSINYMLVALPVLEMFEGIIRFFIRYYVTWGGRLVVICAIVLSTIIMWIYYVCLGKRINKDAFKLPFGVSVVISIAITMLTLMTTFFQYFLMNEESSIIGFIGFVLTIIGSIVLFIVIFGLIHYFNVQSRYQIENEILGTFNEQQRDYFERLLEKENATRQFRHDIIAELTQLRGFCARHEYEELNNYVDAMLNSISDISKSDYDVGNEIVNTILNYYLCPIGEKCRIRVNGYISDDIGISKRDLCIVLSNVVKNAVEAVEGQIEDDPYISFEISKGKMYLYIRMCNSIKEHQVLLIDGKPQTTKKDKVNHGYGIKSIEKIVDEYDGEVVYEIFENTYSIDIKMKCQ